MTACPTATSAPRPNGSATTARRRNRRGTQEVRRLILDAAQSLFVERGFRGVSTRDIAERADVVEVVIYSNFRSKALLFEAAVVEPADQVLVEFIDRWTPAVRGESQMTAACLSALHETVHDHRKVISAVLAAQAYDADLATRLRRRLRQLVSTVLEHSPDPVTDPSRRARTELALGAVLFAAIHGELLRGTPEPQVGDTLDDLLDHSANGHEF